MWCFRLFRLKFAYESPVSSKCVDLHTLRLNPSMWFGYTNTILCAREHTRTHITDDLFVSIAIFGGKIQTKQYTTTSNLTRFYLLITFGYNVITVFLLKHSYGFNFGRKPISIQFRKFSLLKNQFILNYASFSSQLISLYWYISVNCEANIRRINMVESCFGSSGQVSYNFSLFLHFELVLSSWDDLIRWMIQ